jgi:hypothetical protein
VCVPVRCQALDLGRTRVALDSNDKAGWLHIRAVVVVVLDKLPKLLGDPLGGFRLVGCILPLHGDEVDLLPRRLWWRLLSRVRRLLVHARILLVPSLAACIPNYIATVASTTAAIAFAF